MPFTVTYNGNGNDGGSPPVDTKGPYNPGQTVLVAQPTPSSMTKTGATFAYWNTKPDGSGVFHGWPQDTFFAMPATNLTLYAQWFVTTGLQNAGATPHYSCAYDSTLLASGLEPGRTDALINAVEADFGIMSGWFAGITPNGPSPVPVYVTRLTGGANNTGPIRLKPNTPDPNELRSLLVSEITESFMAGQNKGWGFLPGVTNEESCGEALSLFLTQRFEQLQGVTGPYTAFTANNWLNSSLPTSNPNSTRFVYNSDGSLQTDFGSRADYINTLLPFPGNGPGTGCSILFLYYLYWRLGYSIEEIIAAAPGYTNGQLNAIAPLRGVYQNLTGDAADPFPAFQQILGDAFPSDQVSHIPGTTSGDRDNPFVRLLLTDAFSGGNGVLYAIADNGDLLWYHHDGQNDGSFRWAHSHGRRVGVGWDFKTVFSGGNGIIYAITETNDLLWFLHDGASDGSFRWAANSGNKVGVGWDFKTVFSGGNGIIYAITETNDLLWFLHDGASDGSFRWANNNGSKVGAGWDFKTVFSAGNGIIYAIDTTGDLLWYRHDGWSDGTFRWADNNARKVGTGWTFPAVIYAIPDSHNLLWYRHDGWGDGSFKWADTNGRQVGAGWSIKTVFSGGDGVIYAITDSGDLLWYRHEGRGDGSFKWTDNNGRKVGTGWNARIVFSGDDGVIYAITDGGDLLWYRHEGRGDGSFKWTDNNGRKVGTGWPVQQVFFG